MGVFSFRGGVHPAAYKELTSSHELVPFVPQGEMVYPLSQHLGKPAKPVVKKGDTVLMGQLIAEADGFISANIHSACSGKVKAIEHRLTGSSVQAECIVIENDGLFTPMPEMGVKKSYKELTSQEIIEKIRQAGIIGLGGAGFPTYVKMMPKEPDQIHFIVANGAECEPGITCDDRLMREHPDWVVTGLEIVLSLFPNAKGVIAIEENKPEAISIMEKAVKDNDRISVLVLKVKYPQGSERNLVHAVTGGYMESGALPASLGCIVDNVWTLASIYRAVCENTPLIEKGLTLTGDGVINPGNYMVRVGTSLEEVVEAAGGLKEGAKKLILGGPMMGTAVPGTEIPITKSMNALTVYMDDQVEDADAQMTNCIRCGRCTRVCPLGLTPQMMAEAAERKNYDRYIEIHGLDCIQCGTCTYICPAKRPLTALFKQTKPLAMLYMRGKQAKEAAK